jgi:tetratricopeptide (TPR) repeat protein
MRNSRLISALIFLLGVSSHVAHGTNGISSANAGGFPFLNVVEGTVFDPQRRPVPDLWVELQNEFNMSYAKARTSNAGRFTFTGMRPGRYQIKVYTTGTDFEEKTETIEIVSVVRNATDGVYVDLNLSYRKGKDTGSRKSGMVFGQDVPAAARQLFKTGVSLLEKNEYAAAVEQLEQAIKIFPDYYDALDALGCHFVRNKEYLRSLQPLIKAVGLNPRSFSSYYSLGYAAFKLDQLREAAEASLAATVLQPDSLNAQLLYGTVSRLSGSNDIAMASLRKAEKLSRQSPVAEVHWQLALLLNKLKRNKEAAEQLETYLKIEPNAPNKKQVESLIAKLKQQTQA